MNVEPMISQWVYARGMNSLSKIAEIDSWGEIL